MDFGFTLVTRLQIADSGDMMLRYIITLITLPVLFMGIQRRLRGSTNPLVVKVIYFSSKLNSISMQRSSSSVVPYFRSRRFLPSSDQLNFADEALGAYCLPIICKLSRLAIFQMH